MAMDFPNSPSLNQVFGAYTWDGEKWKQTATTAPEPPCGRLTLAAATPIMTATVAGATTIYWTPYLGAQAPFYNGTSWVSQTLAEVSVATNNTTKNPAAIGSSKVNDWFLWNDAGTIRLSHGPDWTNDTTRSAGTALVMVDGIWLNNAAITNACAASRGTYVGTTRSESTNGIAWTLGGSGAGGVEAKLNVWNMYNRVLITPMVSDSSAWTYNSATVRTMDASPTNHIGFVSGLAEDSVPFMLGVRVGCPAALNGSIGVGLDSTISTSGPVARFAGASGTVANDGQITLYSASVPLLGYHFLQALEQGATTAVQFNATGNSMLFTATLRM
jgi:hypothetical protein